MEPGALGRRRRRGGAFSLASLFANGEAGGVYDPSDLTAEKVAWRRNLLTYTEQFDNAVWTKNSTTVVANAAVAPDGTSTADLLYPITTGSNRWVNAIYATPSYPLQYTFTVSLKASGMTWAYVLNNTAGTAAAWIDLSTGTLGTVQSGYTASVVSRGNGWYNLTVTGPAFNGSLYLPSIGIADANNSFTATASGSNGILLWGAQLEVGSTATAYQRITDFTSDFLAAFPTHGLYQDSAGTTPVTALGQPVGLVIDSKTGGLANVGAEQLSNSDFTSNVTGWSAAGSATVTWDSSGAALVDITGAGGGIQDTQTLALTVGQTYRVVASVRAGTYASQLALQANNVTIATITPTATYQTVTAYFRAPSADPPIAILRNLAATGTIFVDFISVREVPGVHAIQPTNSSRPLLDGRVNQLLRSEQFTQSPWVADGATLSANVATAPDSATTATSIILGTGNNRVYQFDNTGITGNKVFSLFVKSNGGSTLSVKSSGSLIPAATAVVNVSSGTVSGFSGASVAAIGDGWYRVFLPVNVLAASGNSTFWEVLGPASSMLIWGADLRLAADAAYPYQRVAAATDYADVGVPRAFAFDGFDDSLYTASNMDLSGTDKVTVLAGVRKLSDAARAILVELSSSYGNNGAFAVGGPAGVGIPNYEFAANGNPSSGTGAYFPQTFAAPITNVLAGLFNLAGATIAQQVIPRVNGAVVQTSGTGSASGGNYGSYVLFIGRRNNASLPFNGKAYQLIVRGALTDAATLAQAERYVGAKTGIFL